MFLGCSLFNRVFIKNQWRIVFILCFTSKYDFPGLFSRFRVIAHGLTQGLDHSLDLLKNDSWCKIQNRVSCCQHIALGWLLGFP